MYEIVCVCTRRSELVLRLSAFVASLLVAHLVVQWLVEGHAILENFAFELAMFCAIWSALDTVAARSFDARPTVTIIFASDRPILQLSILVTAIATVSSLFHLYSFIAECCAFVAVWFVLDLLARLVTRAAS